jgi:hypothetical protein
MSHQNIYFHKNHRERKFFIKKIIIYSTHKINKITNNTYIPLTLYSRRGSRGISDIPPRRPRSTKIISLWVILQTWQVAHRRLIAIYLRCKCNKSFSSLLRHPWKKECGEILLFCPEHHTRRIIIIIILMSPKLGNRPSLRITHKENKP